MGDLIEKYPIFDMTKDEPWHEAGRPLTFTPEEFKIRVTQFFEWCDQENKPLTITRLGVYLCCDRKTLLAYSHRDQFLPAIKKLRNLIEASKNENLLTSRGNVVGYIFDLKNNHDWKDIQDVNVTNKELIAVTISEDKEMINVTPKKKQLRGDKVIEDK